MKQVMRQMAGMGLLVALLLTAVACAGLPGQITAPAAQTVAEAPAPETAAEAASALPAVTFVGSEYAYDGPESIPGGWTEITFDNQGEQPHDLILMRLLDGKTMDDLMAMLQSEDEAPPPDWLDIRGSTSAGPGQRSSFISELPPGSYAMLSFAAGEEAPPDFVQGMVGALTVTENGTAVAESALPQAAAAISMVDYQFVVDGLASGPQLVRLSNDGTELHEAIIFRLKEGKTMADFQAFMESESGEPPMEDAGAVFLSPGNVTYTTLDLEAGNHILICFIPSAQNEGQPHMMLGMLSEVAVE